MNPCRISTLHKAGNGLVQQTLKPGTFLVFAVHIALVLPQKKGVLKKVLKTKKPNTGIKWICFSSEP